LNIKLVKRYFAECGREFKRKYSAIHHEKVCVCWSNPKNRTCKTCKYSSVIIDSASSYETGEYHSKKWNTCKLDIDHYTKFWNQKNDEVDVNINCAFWESKL